MIIHGPGIYLALVGVLIASVLIVAALSQLPPRYRRSLIVFLCFISGGFYVAEFFLPTHPMTREGITAPGNFLTPLIPDYIEPIAAILAAFLLGLGLFSLARIHGNNIIRQRPGWINSLAFMISAFTMIVVGLAAKSESPPKWATNYHELLFNGLYQNMTSAMFSIISFFILSASYRAFRIRNVESSILMLSALVVLLGLSFGVLFTQFLPSEGLAADFKVETWSQWVLTVLSLPALRAIDFGVGLGALAMALRIWLGIERGALFAD